MSQKLLWIFFTMLLKYFSFAFVSPSLHHISPINKFTYFDSALQATVALTRETEKNGKLKDLLQKEGLDVVELPCICHARGEDFDKLVPALTGPERYDYITITSPEAASVFLNAWEQAGKPSDVSVASVGMATSKVLEDAGVQPVFEPSKATAATIVAELPLKGSNKVLYPASAKAKKTLEAGLSDRGFTVTRLNTYTTLPSEWSQEMLCEANGVDVVTFASPSAVNTWADRVGISKPVACIGETSASACKSKGFQCIFFPEKPGMSGWVQAVKDAVQETVPIVART